MSNADVNPELSVCRFLSTWTEMLVFPRVHCTHFSQFTHADELWQSRQQRRVETPDAQRATMLQMNHSAERKWHHHHTITDSLTTHSIIILHHDLLSYTHTRAHKHTHKHMRTHKYAHAHKQACKHMHTRAHTQTYTHHPHHLSLRRIHTEECLISFSMITVCVCVCI